MLEMLSNVFEVCVLPLLGILTYYAVQFIKVKADEIAVRTEDVLSDKYIYMVRDTVVKCVNSTTQTYVDALKKQSKFDAEAQKIAFDKTYEAVMSVLNEEAKQYLASIYGDVNIYITNQIEATVRSEKDCIK